MERHLSIKIIELAKLLPNPLYIVGGFVRNFLISGYVSKDVDLASANKLEDILECAKKLNIEIKATYKRTGTVVFVCDDKKYEHTTFRIDSYVGGEHLPKSVNYTTDIYKDATRRDFKCNAIYYDILNKKIVDPLGGVLDIKNKVLDTVKEPNDVFSFDGLRLMRLVRFSAELGLNIKKEVFISAKQNADKILDISSERILTELKMILLADKKYPFSKKDAPIYGIKLLNEIGVYNKIVPFAKSNADYSKLKNCDSEVRFMVLLNEIDSLENLKTVLQKLKVDNKTKKLAEFIYTYKDVDIELESELRLFIINNYNNIDLLLKVKSANKKDYSVIRWKKLIEKMNTDNTPKKLSDLCVSGKNLQEMGIFGDKIGKTLNVIFNKCVVNPALNNKKSIKEIIETLNI